MTERKISVMVVSATLATGGAQRFTSTLLTHLNRERFAPSLALLRDDIGYPLAPDVPVHHLAYRGPLTFFAAGRRLSRVIDKIRPDVLLSNITATNLISGCALRTSRHQPRWIARIGSNPTRHDSRFRRLLARRVYGRVDQFVANSRGLAGELTGHYRIDPSKTSVIGNPTDFAELDRLASEPPERVWCGETPLLIAVGRLFPEKRYDVMLDAFAAVRRRRPVHLWICGEGPSRRSIERQVRRLGLHDCVELLGHCGNPYALMRQASLFVMTSDHEGLPNALIEAQGLGLPAVATRCPYGPDEIIIEGKTGLLGTPGDAISVARSINSHLLKPEALLVSEKIGQRMKSRFDASDISRNWETVFLKLCYAHIRTDAIN